MKEQFSTYEIALVVKELGFNEPCLMWYYHENNLSDDLIFKQYYDENYFCNAPLWQQVIDWLRITHNLIIDISGGEVHSKSYFNNLINLREIHYSYSVYSINERFIDSVTIERAKIMSCDTLEQTEEFIDKTLKFVNVGSYDTYYECREKAILSTIDYVKRTQFK